MLNFFRKSLQGASIKFLIGILVLTFILWGIGDTFKYIGGEPSYVIKVGSVEYSLNDWQRVIRYQKQMIQEKYGRTFSDEELKQFGFFNRVLDQFIGKSLLFQEAKSLNILVSDELIKNEITSSKAFQDSDGKFNQTKFKEFLKGAGIAEDKVIENLKDEISAEHLMQSLISFSAPVPQVIEQLNLAHHAIRDVTVYSIDVAKLPVIASPKREQLESILQEHQTLFSTPEIRSASYILFNKANVDNSITLSDAEIEAAYKDKLYLFTHPEKREVLQLIFDNLDAANNAKKEAELGKSFKDIGAALKAKNKNVIMGTFTKDNFDSSIGNAIFTSSVQKVTEPVKTALGYHVFQVSKIIPEHVQQLSEVKQQLLELLTKEKVFERLYTLSQQLNTAIAGGKSIGDIAKQYQLPIYKSVVTEQKVISNNASDIEKSQVFHAAVFSTNQAQTSMVTPFKDDTFFVVHTDHVEHKRLKAFNEVEQELLKIWNNQQQVALASELFGELGAPFGTPSQGGVLEKYKKYVNIQSFKVSGDTASMSKVLTQEAISDIQKMSIGKVSKVYNTADNIQVVVKLNKISAPASDVLSKTKDAVQYLYLQHQADDTIAQYINFLKTKYEVKVNKKLLEQHIN